MKLFGTDGLRGRAGVFPLDPASVRRIAREVAESLPEAPRRTVVLAGDTRESTPGLVAELSAGISEAGGRVASAGVLPTPAVAELVLALHAGAGISVSASHNPYQDNGIKIFGPDGRKWPDAQEDAVERVLLAAREAHGDTGRGDGETALPEADPSLAETYLNRLLSHQKRDLDGLPVVLDAGNGAAFRVGPEALRRAGARVTVLADRPDGRNINAGCGALAPAAMAKATRERGAAIGVALDGDADRSIFSDESGRILDGDDALWIIAREWKREGLLPPGGVVGTVMSNYGLEAALELEGIPFCRAAVGDRNVARLMEESGAALGGETSGHILLPFSPAGDGIATTLLLASILRASGGPLSRLATLAKTPQVLRNVRVARRVPFEGLPSIARAIEQAREALAHRGRVFLRYSGTEPLLRILVEGSEEKQVVSIADQLEAAVRAELD
ncbi:MAG TPA: phosphoglucosamine mutase [Thermoanaerobaculia bacterium]|nr:phosphoglucosamine mutase [Thermoanaerobaculia bacterium]